MTQRRKLSISMPAETVEIVRTAAAAEGLSVSAWLTRAARIAAARQQRLVTARAASAVLLSERDVTHGGLPAASRARAGAFLDELAADDAHALDEAM